MARFDTASMGAATTLAVPAVQSRAVMRQLADEFGALDRELAALDPKRERHKQLREQITGWFDNEDAAKEFTVEGARYCVTVSPRQRKRRIRDMAKLMKRLGQKLFLQLASFSLETLDKHIPAAEHATLVEETRTGPRRLSVTLKFTEAA